MCVEGLGPETMHMKVITVYGSMISCVKKTTNVHVKSKEKPLEVGSVLAILLIFNFTQVVQMLEYSNCRFKPHFSQIITLFMCLSIQSNTNKLKNRLSTFKLKMA